MFRFHFRLIARYHPVGHSNVGNMSNWIHSQIQSKKSNSAFSVPWFSGRVAPSGDKHVFISPYEAIALRTNRCRYLTSQPLVPSCRWKVGLGEKQNTFIANYMFSHGSHVCHCGKVNWDRMPQMAVKWAKTRLIIWCFCFGCYTWCSLERNGYSQTLLLVS